MKTPPTNMHIRDAVKQGMGFYQWLATQRPKPHKSELNKLQLRFEQIEDFYQHPLNDAKPKKQHTEYVVINLQGFPRKEEWRTLTVHSNETDAGEHGKKFYDYRQFIVQPLSKFQMSKAYKWLKIRNHYLDKAKEIKAAKQK